MVIKWNKTSIEDLKNFKKYSKSSNINQYISKTVRYVDVLKEQPRIGKIYLYAKGHIIRQLIYEKHRIFYYIDEDVIHIISMIHHRQSIQDKVEFIKKKYQ